MTRRDADPALSGVPDPQERRSHPGGASGASAARSSIAHAKGARNRAPRRLVEEIREKHPVMARQAASGSRRAAIRLFCLDCMGGSPAEVERCGSFECPLWPYRRGRGVERQAPRAGDARGG